MFVIFGKYELILAAIALAACGMWLVSYPAPGVVALLALFIVAAGIATVVGLGLTTEMESLRVQGKIKTEEFKSLHGKSMMAMTGQCVVLFAAGAMLVRAARQPNKPPAA